MRDQVFVPPSRAELDALLSSSIVTDGLIEAAQIARDYAEATAPVDTGAYRSRFRVEQSGGEVYVVNDDEAAAAIEFGTADTPAHLTLMRAVDRTEGGG